MKCESCTKYDDCRTGSGLTWPCGAYQPKDKPNCIGCHHMHPDNGNCTAVGGFCTAVPAAYCPLIPELRAENEKLRDEVESFKKGHCAGCSIPAVKAEQIRDLTDAPKLRAELEQVKHALAMMWFAYVNSDKETPHSYETEAIEEAERLLGPWEECMPKYLRRGQKED